MKKLVLIFFLIIINACNVYALENVKEFSGKVRGLVSAKDIKGLKELPVFPDSTIDSDEISYLLGCDAKGVGVISFIAQSEVLVKIYGPYKTQDSNKNSIYSIVYYNPSKVKPKDGTFSYEDQEKHWGVAYIETLVTVINDKVMFYRTPFYSGAHAPWAGDY